MPSRHSSIDNIFRAVSVWGFGAQVARGTYYSVECLWGEAQPHWFGHREREDWVQRDWAEPDAYGGRDDWRRANGLPPIKTDGAA
jgi:hypothetical protein